MKKFALLMLTVPSIAVAAPSPVQLVSSIMAEKTVIVAGHEQITLSSPDKIVPGDKLVFQISYKNSGSVAATNIVVTNPVPSAVAYGGFSTPGSVMSVDGGRTFAPVGMLKVKGADGQLRAAQAEDVTTLRWTLTSVAPGASGILKYRGVVR